MDKAEAFSYYLFTQELMLCSMLSALPLVKVFLDYFSSYVNSHLCHHCMEQLAHGRTTKGGL